MKEAANAAKYKADNRNRTYFPFLPKTSNTNIRYQRVDWKIVIVITNLTTIISS